MDTNYSLCLIGGLSIYVSLLTRPDTVRYRPPTKPSLIWTSANLEKIYIYIYICFHQERVRFLIYNIVLAKKTAYGRHAPPFLSCFSRAQDLRLLYSKIFLMRANKSIAILWGLNHIIVPILFYEIFCSRLTVRGWLTLGLQPKNTYNFYWAPLWFIFGCKLINLVSFNQNIVYKTQFFMYFTSS